MEIIALALTPAGLLLAFVGLALVMGWL